jgi:hypothetical protein
VNNLRLAPLDSARIPAWATATEESALGAAQELVTKENSAEFSITIALIKSLIPEKLISLLSTFQDY